MEKPTKRGGRREGAGRKPLPPERRKRKLTIEIAPDLYDWIKALPRGETERILKKSYIEAHIIA